MRKYIVFVETYDILPHSVSYTCDENTLETTLRVARDTKDMVRVEVKEITNQDVEEVKESNEPVKNVYIIVDNDFDPDYYKESNDVSIKFDGKDEIRKKYLVTGYESEIDNFLEEAKQHILDIGKTYLLYKIRKTKQHTEEE